MQIHGASEERYGLVFFRQQEDQEKALNASKGKLFFGMQIEVTAWIGPGEPRPLGREAVPGEPRLAELVSASSGWLKESRGTWAWTVGSSVGSSCRSCGRVALGTLQGGEGEGRGRGRPAGVWLSTPTHLSLVLTSAAAVHFPVAVVQREAAQGVCLGGLFSARILPGVARPSLAVAFDTQHLSSLEVMRGARGTSAPTPRPRFSLPSSFGDWTAVLMPPASRGAPAFVPLALQSSGVLAGGGRGVVSFWRGPEQGRSQDGRTAGLLPPETESENEFRPLDERIDEFHPKATRTLFIGNLEKTTTYHDLRNIFQRFGGIVVRTAGWGRGGGCAGPEALGQLAASVPGPLARLELVGESAALAPEPFAGP